MSIEFNEYIELFLKVDDVFDRKFNKISTIKTLLLGAREFSGRNLKTGVYEGKDLNEYDFTNDLYITKRFNGILLYLIFLEQLGNIFQSTNSPYKEKGINRTLLLFSKNIKDDKIIALSGLRNSLAHRYSLCTEKKGNNSFKYTLNWGENEQIIELPTIRWNGDFKQSDENTYSIIYVQSLTDEIEFIYNEAIFQLKTKLVKLDITIDELNSRYTIIN